MASYYDCKAKAPELMESSLIDIAGMLIDLEEKIEAHENTIEALEEELAQARAEQ